MIHHQSSAVHQDKPVLVFVHGLSCDGSDWQAQQRHFEASHQCICVDLRGHGQSAAMSGPYDIETLAADVVALLHKLNIQRSILIGHSMGTRVIAAAHIQAPEMIHGLVFVDGSKQAEGDPLACKQAILDRIGDDAQVGPFLRNMFGMMFTADSDPARRDHIIQRAVDMPPALLKALLSNMLAWDAGRMASAYSLIKVALTVVQSTDVDQQRKRHSLTENQSTRYLEFIRKTVPHARRQVIANTGHFTQIDAAAAVNNAIEQLLVALPRC